MDQVLMIAKEIFSIAPGSAAAIIVAWMFFKNRTQNNDNIEKYVLKSDCNLHVDGIKEGVNNIKESIIDLQEKIDETRLSVARIEGKLETKK
jgi:hypothetical protein